MDEIHDTRLMIAKSRINEITEREKHYKLLAEVFGTENGVKVAEWLLDLTGYWSGICKGRSIGKYEIGKTIVDHICMADTEIFNEILSRRKHTAVTAMEREKAELHHTL